MPNHPTVENLTDERLSAYLDNQVSVQERQQMEAQLAEDPAAAQTLNELRYTVGLLKQIPSVTPRRSFLLSEPQVTDAGVGQTHWLSWLNTLVLRGAAVAIALCLMVFVMGDLGARGQLPDFSQQPSVASNPSEGLAGDQGNPTAIIGKTSTTNTSQESSGFLGLSPTGVLTVEIALAVALLLLLAALWQRRVRNIP